MSETTTFLAKRRGIAAVIGLLILIGLVLAGCGGEPTAAPIEPAKPTEIAAEPGTATSALTKPPPTSTPTEPPPTSTPTEPPPTDTPTPTEEPTPEPIDDTACIACHTDEETLKAVAVEEEKPEVESEGEG